MFCCITMATSTNYSSRTFVIQFYDSDFLVFASLNFQYRISPFWNDSELLPIKNYEHTKNSFWMGVSSTSKLWVLALCTQIAKLWSITPWQDLFYVQSREIAIVCDRR